VEHFKVLYPYSQILVKHASLFRRSVSDEQKQFPDIHPRLEPSIAAGKLWYILDVFPFAGFRVAQWSQFSLCAN
jgi:hypothetical protein